MSQKPRTGAPAPTPSVSKVAPKDVVMKSDPAKARPVAKTEPVAKAGPVEVDPVAKAEPVTAEVVAKVEPASRLVAETEPFKREEIAKSEQVQIESFVEPEPLVKVEPVMNEIPVAKAEPIVEVVFETKVSAPDTADKTIAAASDLAAASAKAISGTMTTTADTVAAVSAEAVETASSIMPTTPTLTQGMKTMMKTTEDFVAFGQANLEAFVKSGQIWSAGVQELTKQIASSAKASFDESVSTFKAISTAKSVKEAIDLQSSFAKAALEKAMAESNKLTDASIKLTEQTLAPITARVTVAVETFGKAA